MLVPTGNGNDIRYRIDADEDADGLTGSCVYKPHLFRRKGIDRLLQDFQAVLEQMLTQPELPISQSAFHSMRNPDAVASRRRFCNLQNYQSVRKRSKEVSRWEDICSAFL